MCAIEEFYKFFISYNARIELNLYSFCVMDHTPCISNSRGEDSFVLCGREMLQENMLDAPKTAPSENGNLGLSSSWLGGFGFCRLEGIRENTSKAT